MSKRSEKRAAKVAQIVETTPVVIAHDEVAEVNAAQKVETTTDDPKVETLVQTSVADATEKKGKYASASAIGDLTQIITFVRANPKRANSKSFKRYADFHKVGQSLAEFIAAYKEAKLGSLLARNDLRWDLEHGFIKIEAAPATPMARYL